VLDPAADAEKCVRPWRFAASKHRCLRLRYLLPLQSIRPRLATRARLSISMCGLSCPDPDSPIPARLRGAAVASKGALPISEPLTPGWPSPCAWPRPPLSGRGDHRTETMTPSLGTPHAAVLAAWARRGSALSGTASPLSHGESPSEVPRAARPYLATARQDARRVTPEARSGNPPYRAKASATTRCSSLHTLLPGSISVEWEKKCTPDLANPELALPQHASGSGRCVYRWMVRRCCSVRGHPMVRSRPRPPSSAAADRPRATYSGFADWLFRTSRPGFVRGSVSSRCRATAREDLTLSGARMDFSPSGPVAWWR